MLSRTRGFTLVELLVVTAIIGLLVALLLPAIQAVRESARRAQCANHLHQIGVAMQLFHDAKGEFPSAYISRPDGITGSPNAESGDAGPGWTCLMQILPFIEGSNTRGAFDLNQPCWATGNATPALQVVATFLCPSVSEPSLHYAVKDDSGTVLCEFSRSHYVANAGQKEVWEDPTPDLRWTANGPLFRNSRIRVKDITDGTSHTVFLGEKSPAQSDATWVGIVPGAVTCPTDQFPLSHCEPAAPQINVHSGPSESHDHGDDEHAASEADGDHHDHGHDDHLRVIHAPNDPAGYVDSMNSEHPGGANVLMGDGSVRFVSEMINQLVWSAMATRAGHEVVDDTP